MLGREESFTIQHRTCWLVQISLEKAVICIATFSNAVYTEKKECVVSQI